MAVIVSLSICVLIIWSRLLSGFWSVWGRFLIPSMMRESNWSIFFIISASTPNTLPNPIWCSNHKEMNWSSRIFCPLPPNFSLFSHSQKWPFLLSNTLHSFISLKTRKEWTHLGRFSPCWRKLPKSSPSKVWNLSTNKWINFKNFSSQNNFLVLS